MCTVKWSIQSNTFQIDDTDLITDDICEKCVQIFKMGDSSVSHEPIYASFLDDSPVSHPLGKVLKSTKILIFFFILFLYFFLRLSVLGDHSFVIRNVGRSYKNKY